MTGVVTNAGPLLAFSKLNALPLLQQLYDRIDFPTAVYQETVEAGLQRGYEDARTLKLFFSQTQWNPTPHVSIPHSVFSSLLDQGEKEAIALALSKNSLLLIDEEKGRKVAREHGLTVRGSLGVFIQAYRNNLITEAQLRLFFSQICQRTDIWISPVLCQNLLQQVLP